MKVQKVYLVADLDYVDTSSTNSDEVTEALQDADLICNEDSWIKSGIDNLKVGDRCHDMGHVIQDVSERYVNLDLSDEVTRHEHYIWTTEEQWLAMSGKLEDCSCTAGTGCKK